MRQEEVKTLVVHYLDAPAGTTCREIDRKHRARGNLYCCYHWLIRDDGHLDLGRPFNSPGMGATEDKLEPDTLAVCVINRPEAVTELQSETLNQLLSTLRKVYPFAEVIYSKRVDKFEPLKET